MQNNHYSFETNCVHGGYRAASGQPQEAPLVQSTTYRYYNNADVAALFDLESPEFMYTRLGNPTLAVLEEKMALLEGGVAAVSAASGQAATLMCMLNLCEKGDHILASTNIYGGSNNLLTVSFAGMGIDCTLINPDVSLDELLAAAKPNTKVLFAETLGNPALSVLDFEKWSAAAKKLGVPLVVDNTLATPALCRPLEHGANIVIHSTTKYSDGHATSVGGMVIDGGNFDWKASGKFKGLTEPNESYHGLIYTEKFGAAAFAAKLRSHLLRDFGCTMAPISAYLLNLGLESMALRVRKHSENALEVAKFLETQPQVLWVNYPKLPSSPYHELAEKYLPDGASGVVSFGVKGGRAAAMKLMNSLCLAQIVVHVADARTCVLHPASTTHRQLTDQQLADSGIGPEFIRFSVGIEDVRDIIADLKQALAQID